MDITAANNAGESWGTSNAIKGNDDVSAPPLCICICLWFYLSFFKFRSAKKSKIQSKKDTLI